MDTSTAFAAIAASAAEPPSFKMSRAAWEDRGCDVAAMPFRASTGLRVANGRPVGRLPPLFWKAGLALIVSATLALHSL